MPPLPMCFPARFELRLHQDDGLKRGSWPLPHCGEHRGQNQRGGDERHIHGYKTDTRTKIARLEIAGIGALAQAHARISAQGLGDLPVTGVDRYHAGCAMLQHAIGKSTGGGANVDAVPPGKVDFPVDKGGFQLQSTAADVTLFFSQNPSSAVSSTEAPGFSTFCWLTNTRPARISACARSLDGANPRSSSNLSSRFLIQSGCDYPSHRDGRRLLYSLLPGYFSLALSVRQP